VSGLGCAFVGMEQANVQGNGQGDGEGNGQGNRQGDGQGNGQGNRQGDGQGSGQGNGQGDGQGNAQGIKKTTVQINAEIRTALDQLRGRLRDIINPDMTLLTKLVSKDVISREEMEEISNGQRHPTISKKVDKLLECLVNKSTCDFSEVMTVFEDADQKHVVNFINSRGGTFEI
jgi:hypothetical protein